MIGDPVRHSLSPAIHNAAFRETGLDWVYLAFEVAPGAAAAAVAAMGALGLEGLNATMPHKADVARAVDRLSPVAAELGAVNTVAREG
ncbi:MAG: shikimate dehydrogenase, partial [Actinomycetota bacterium]|nr:shikimate dehydrogenase [Actinomycetota bacterium]